MEYIQDTDGAWLEPHRDIPEKLFSMVIYLCTGPEAKEWGTDIYDDQKKWIGRTSAEFNSAVIFVPGPNTWHGFERRPDHRRAPPDGDQLRPAELARSRPACISGPADLPGIGVPRFMLDLRTAGGQAAHADRGFTTKSFYGVKGGAEHFIAVVVPSDLDSAYADRASSRNVTMPPAARSACSRNRGFPAHFPERRAQPGGADPQ